MTEKETISSNNETSNHSKNLSNQKNQAHCKKKSPTILDKTIDAIFNIQQPTIYFFLILFLGFLLRLITAINLPVTADDMHHVTYAINFYKSGRLITYEQSAGLWHAFTSIMYELFGMTQLSSRLTALIFGTLTIIVIYLLTREFFNKKISLIAAFLTAIAPFHIRNTMAEMDVMAMFFALTSMLLFIRATKTKKTISFVISGIFLGLAIYTKVYPLLFAPSYILYFIFTKKKEKSLTKQNISKLFLVLIIASMFAIPTLTHNYLLYKDKGFVDLHFTRVLGLGRNITEQYYGFDAAFHRSSSWTGLFFGDTRHIVSGTPLLLGAIDFIRQGDPINFYLGFLGLFLILINKNSKKKYPLFFLFSILFILPYLAANILLAKHYLFLELFLIPPSALAVYKINKKLSNLFHKKTTKILLSIILIIALLFLGMPKGGVSHVYGKSHIAQMIEFKNKNIPENALIVADSRMYRGRINWAFQERPYLEGTNFMQLANSQDNLPGEPVNIEVYFFECIPDDCGWGTIKDQPEFNQSMESLVVFFKENGQLVKTISEPDRSKRYYPLFLGEKIEIVNIYKTELTLKTSILTVALQPKNWWLYDIGYEPREKQFDYYQTYTNTDVFLDKFAHWILKLSLILTFLSPIYIFYLLYKKQNETLSNNPGL